MKRANLRNVISRVTIWAQVPSQPHGKSPWRAAPGSCLPVLKAALIKIRARRKSMRRSCGSAFNESQMHSQAYLSFGMAVEPALYAGKPWHARVWESPLLRGAGSHERQEFPPNSRTHDCYQAVQLVHIASVV